MKEVMNFCKLYLPEILFAVAVLLCIGITMYGVFCLPKEIVMGIAIFAIVALSVLGYWFQKLEKAVSQPSKVFTVEWYVGFALLMFALIASVGIVYSSAEKFPLYIMLIISGIAFVAMFGHLVIVSSTPAQKNKYSSVTTDACDDD